MTKKEALEILGLEWGCIKGRYYKESPKVNKKNHPDIGVGLDYKKIKQS